MVWIVHMWNVVTTDRSDSWYVELDEEDRNNIAAYLLLLEREGPQLSRPYADTLHGSVLTHLKELRIQSKGKPLRAFLLLILKDRPLYLVMEIKVETSDFIKR